MAGANKRTSGVLIVLALLFIVTVIIICLTFDNSQPGYTKDPKTNYLQSDVLTNTPPTTTTTTTTTTTKQPVTSPTTQPPATSATVSTTSSPPTTTTATTTASPPPATTPVETSTATTSSTTELKTTTTHSSQPPEPATTPKVSTTVVPPSATTPTTPPPPPPTTTTTTTTTTDHTSTVNATTPSPRTSSLPPATTTITPVDTSTIPTSSTTEQTTTTSRPPPPPLPTTTTVGATVSTPPSSTTPESSTTISTAPPATTTTTSSAATTTGSPSPQPLTTSHTTTTTAQPSSPITTSTPDVTLLTTDFTSPPPNNATAELSSPQSISTTSEAPASTIRETQTTPVTSQWSTHSTDSSFAHTSTTSHSPSSTSTPCPQPDASNSTDICMTPACKTLAARMLDLMDHSVKEPCEDFYQYACGGVTDDLFLNPENRQEVTRRLILEHLMDLSVEDPHLGPLKAFYDSCTSAEMDSHNKTFWLSQVKSVVDLANSTGESLFMENTPVNITQILIRMMKINFAPFFDLLLDQAVDGSDRFVLMLTPPIMSSPFSKDMAWALCYGEYLNHTKLALDSESPSYDVNEEYKKYSECVDIGDGLYKRLEQMTNGVKELGLLHLFNYTIHSQGAEGLLVDNRMNVEFLYRYLHEYNVLPTKPELHDGHLKKIFKTVTLSYLTQTFYFNNFKVEWQILVEELIGHPVDPDNITIHIYFEDQLLNALYEIDTRNPLELRRMLLLLLTERVYTDLVEPAQHNLGKPEYCLQVTTELFGDFISSLYLKALPHLQERQQKMEEMIKENMETAEMELSQQQNLTPDEKEKWQSKLRGMSGEVASPEPSQYLLQDMNETALSDNFVDNYIFMLTRYRSLMYQQYQASPSSHAVLWSHFLKPFSPSAISLYASNKFLVPYGAMEAPFFIQDVPDYINYAGIGQMIAHVLMHGFDGTGIEYNGTQQQTWKGFSHFVGLSECLIDQYRSQQSLTDASGLTANFTLGRLPLNEVLTASGAVRLAWKAYEHSRLIRRGKGIPIGHTTPEPQLPWLDLNPLQLYFLRSAQVYCSATSDVYMLPLMETEHIPHRMRVNLVLQNEPLFTEAFNCPAPQRQCPYVLGQAWETSGTTT